MPSFWRVVQRRKSGQKDLGGQDAPLCVLCYGRGEIKQDVRCPACHGIGYAKRTKSVCLVCGLEPHGPHFPNTHVLRNVQVVSL